MPVTRWVPRPVTTISTAKSSRFTNCSKRLWIRRARRVCWATTFWAPDSISTCSRITATVPISAAKRLHCWNRWRAKKASRASNRRFRPVLVCMASRPRSTIPNRLLRCRSLFAMVRRNSSNRASRTMAAPSYSRFPVMSIARATTKFRSVRHLPSCWKWLAACAAARS